MSEFTDQQMTRRQRRAVRGDAGHLNRAAGLDRPDQKGQGICERSSVFGTALPMVTSIGEGSGSSEPLDETTLNKNKPSLRPEPVECTNQPACSLASQTAASVAAP